MKATTFITALGALWLASGATALAQGKSEAPKPEGAKPEAGKPMGPPPVPKEMDDLKWFIGEWKCTGEAAGPEPGQTHKSTSENSVKPDFGGHWLAVKHHEPKTKDNPAEFTAMGWWGYDAIAKTFTGLFAGSYGAWETRTAQGWHGDTFVWTGKLHGFHGTDAPLRHTFVKKGDKEGTEKFEVEADRKWTTVEENTCKKK